MAQKGYTHFNYSLMALKYLCSCIKCLLIYLVNKNHHLNLCIIWQGGYLRVLWLIRLVIIRVCFRDLIIILLMVILLLPSLVEIIYNHVGGLNILIYRRRKLFYTQVIVKRIKDNKYNKNKVKNPH